MEHAHIDPSTIGSSTGYIPLQWEQEETLFYALSVGAGRERLADLAYVTENTANTPHQVLPSFATILALRVGRPKVGVYPYSALVHAEQEVVSLNPLPSSMTHAIGETTVKEITDQRSGCFVVYETTVIDPATQTPFFSSTATVFIKGVFSGRVSKTQRNHKLPTRTPDMETSMSVRPEQALLYRLNGDRNRLHSDPVFAEEAGFTKPILHGLCTFGMTCHHVHSLGVEPHTLKRMRGRFTKPVYPGEDLTLRIWETDSGALFEVLNSLGDRVLSNGLWKYSPH